MDEIINSQILNKDDESYATYSEASQSAAINEQSFSTFKQNPNYTYELEHTSPPLGEHYITLLKKEHEEDIKKINWDNVRLNDKYGGTNKYQFSKLEPYCGKDFGFSPTTIGYLYLALRMVNSLKEKDIKEVDVFEIGCGYGGQCFLFNIVADFLEVTVNSYNLVDLKYPILLQKKYLSLAMPRNKKFRFWPCDEYNMWKGETGNVDYVISNYALSEMSSEWGERYIESIIKKAKHGFFQFNGGDAERFKGNLQLSTLLENLSSPHTAVSDPGNPPWTPHGYCKLIEF
tara:strand:+ start:4875 stop:5738 length:864 start_codon:yes stop_codon:yes gene_type:complete